MYAIRSYYAPILNAAISVPLVAIYEMGAVGRLGGQMLSRLIIAVICIIALRKFLLTRINFSIFTVAIKLAWGSSQERWLE